MVGIITLTVLGAGLTILKLGIDLRRNIEKAKSTGLPYIVGPFISLGYFWKLVARFLSHLPYIPGMSEWGWLKIITPHDSFRHPRRAEELHGDTFCVVTPYIISLRTSNAELGSQVTTRRNDFLKPVARYKIMDIFGRSILTSEGLEWKRHKRVVGPSFSEKSNRLVFEESLRQVEGMLDVWVSRAGNTKQEMRIGRLAVDMATLSFHVICAAGFGVPQVWDETEEKDNKKALPGFGDLRGNHEFSFKMALTQLLRNLMPFIVFPTWLLKKSPFESHQRAYKAFKECNEHFEEILETKKKEMYLGEDDSKGTMDLLGRMIRANYEIAPPGSKPEGPDASQLSQSEIRSNSFIFLFAGHETTANAMHYTILELAMSLRDQRRMQADIDNVVGDKPTSEWSYLTDMPRLYNSMVGAAIHEELRLIPAIVGIPKQTNVDQTVVMDGRSFVIPADTFVYVHCIATNRNPRYWPESPNEFIPERWLPKISSEKENINAKSNEVGDIDGLEVASFETSGTGTLFKPIKGSYNPFSEGARACPGRRFAQVEATAVMSAIFQRYSVELDVSDWASDDEVEEMGVYAKRGLYQMAIERAQKLISMSEQTITFQLKRGDHVPLRFVERGRERFLHLY